MFKNYIVSLQRKIRANLSFFFNKNEILDHRESKLVEHIFINAKKIDNKYKKNYKKTHKIFSSQILDLILKKKLLNFLQLSFIQKMFFVHNRLFLLFYLIEFKSLKNWNYWKKLLKENNIGNPVRYFLYPFTSGNKLFQTYHLKKYNDFSKINLNKFDFILEFGGGYGNMAYTFLKINKNCRYIIFDTEEVNLLQYYYLKKCKIKVSYDNKYILKKGVLLVNSINKIKKILNKNKWKKGLLIANWSISEVPLYFRNKLSFLFNQFDFQLISFQRDFENINNLNYFLDINKVNKSKNRRSALIPIYKIKNNYYLFSKK